MQTSNSLLLAEARHPTRNGDNTNEVLAIVGSCDAVLHIEYDKTAAISFLGSSLPVFADIELFSGVDDANPACSTSGGAARDKSGVFQNCPFSDGQCQSAWSDLMAFEHNGTAFGPSPILCLQVWQAMIDACYAGDISIQHPISMAQVRAHIEPDGIPADLIYAIVGQVSCDKPGNVASTCK